MRPQPPTTREQLIEAGIRLFREGRATILRSLTAGTVAAEAGYHRQTFYRHWDTQCDYVGELMEVVFAIGEPPVERRSLIDTPASTFEDRVRQHARKEIDRLWDDPKGAVRIGLLAMGQLSEGRPRELAEAFYQDSVSSWRPPWPRSWPITTVSPVHRTPSRTSLARCERRSTDSSSRRPSWATPVGRVVCST